MPRRFETPRPRRKVACPLFFLRQIVKIAKPAPPATIGSASGWAQVSDFNTWKRWQPWWKSSQKITIDGTPGVVGHKSSWEGEKTGKGWMEITDVKQPNHLGLKLVAIEPMAGGATLAFDVAEGSDGSKVTWKVRLAERWALSEVSRLGKHPDMTAFRYRLRERHGG